MRDFQNILTTLTMLAVFAVLPSLVSGQQGFVCSGGNTTGATASISFSAGLVAPTPTDQNGYKLTHGIQQPAGCTDPLADQFDDAAIVDDGSCTFDNLTGCTDPLADNYSPTAQNDDGSCTYDNVTGCTDPAANNYDPANIFDDGSCTYNGCLGDLNGDLAINTGDLVVLLGLFGSVCP